jgi:hypothetical protein
LRRVWRIFKDPDLNPHESVLSFAQSSVGRTL